MSLKLYQLTDEMLRVLDVAASYEGDMADILDGIHESFENKCISVAKYIKSLEAESKAIDETAKAMAARAKSKAKQAESLTDYLRHNLEKSGLAEPIKAVEFDIRLQNNPGKLIIDEPEKIPELYKHWVVTRELQFHKDKIKEDIKEFGSVEGARIEVNKRVVIK